MGGDPWLGRAFPWLVNFLVRGRNFIFREMIGVQWTFYSIFIRFNRRFLWRGHCNLDVSLRRINIVFQKNKKINKDY